MGPEFEAYTTAATMAAPAGIGKPTKYLRLGRPGFLGTGFFCTLKRARRADPHNRNRNATKWPALRICSRNPAPIAGSTDCTPQANARTAGAMPKLITSARESISRPKSLVVLVMRAMRPSRPSSNTATPMVAAANMKCCSAPGAPVDARMAPCTVRITERNPKKNIAGGEQRGKSIGGARRTPVRRLRLDPSLQFQSRHAPASCLAAARSTMTGSRRRASTLAPA